MDKKMTDHANISLPVKIPNVNLSSRGSANPSADLVDNTRKLLNHSERLACKPLDGPTKTARCLKVFESTFITGRHTCKNLHCLNHAGHVFEKHSRSVVQSRPPL